MVKQTVTNSKTKEEVQQHDDLLSFQLYLNTTTRITEKQPDNDDDVGGQQPSNKEQPVNQPFIPANYPTIQHNKRRTGRRRGKQSQTDRRTEFFAYIQIYI